MPNIKNYKNTFDHIENFKLHRANALGARELFWQGFDGVILQGILDGEITPLRERLTAAGGRVIAIRVSDLYHYQLDLLERIEEQAKIPFNYKRSFNYLNREFYRRQGLTAKAIRVGSEVVFGVEIEFEPLEAD
jgi:hypothetical protein